MKPLRTRLTVRTLMLGVALLAITFGGFIECERRRERFRDMAARYNLLRLQLYESASFPDNPLDRAKADYFGRMWLKYKQAARFPWLPIKADPTEPR